MSAQEPRPAIGDAFGLALLDVMAGGAGTHVVERDDGLVEAMPASDYFTEAADWGSRDVSALDAVAGRVLDVGAGAGRFALELQNRGHEVMALDTSPGAIEVCRARGVAETFLGPVTALAAEAPASFDSLALMGNNLALLESAATAGAMFDAMRHLLRPGGVAAGTCLDPYLTDEAFHLVYQEQNRLRGRMSGQIGLRVRFRFHATGWFDYMFLAPDELAELAARSGWRLDDVTEPDPTYLAVLRPE